MPAKNPDTISAYPTGAINGMQIAWGSNTTLTVTSGTCRDSSDTCNMAVATASTTINAANAAVVNGLDAGSLAASTQYGVFVIGDSMGKNASGFLLSASATPLLPAGYDSYRLIGYWFTDGSSHFLLGYYFGASNLRKFQYDSVQSVLSAGVATAFTAIDCSAFVPSLTGANTPIALLSQYNVATAGNKASFRPTGGTGTTPIDLTGLVAAHSQDSVFTMLSGFASSKAEIDYKVANGSDALTVSVLGFEIAL